MAGKAEEIFERVYSAVNQRRGKQGGGTLTKPDLEEILSELGISKEKDWRPALYRAKNMTPNLYELFYKAFGKDPPSGYARKRQEAEVEEAAPAEEAEDGPVSMIDCFTTVAHWCGRVTPDERRRILAAVQVLYPEEA